MSARISVVSVSFHTGPALRESLGAALADPDVAEVVLVDNGNSEQARQQLAALHQAEPRLRLLQGHGNIGFGRACNYGAALATGTHLLFLNPDAVLEAGAARGLLEAGEAAGGLWLAGGRLVDADGTEQRGSRRDVLSFATALGTYTPLRGLGGLRSINRHTEPLPDTPVDMPTVSGAFFMMARQGFDAAGGFDTGYFLHVEDIALCRSVRERGGRVLFVPSARVVHYGSTSDASALSVDWHKAKGFVRYFTTGKRGAARLGGALLALPIAAAILARAAWRTVRGRA